jgi:hypothetical protein
MTVLLLSGKVSRRTTEAGRDAFVEAGSTAVFIVRLSPESLKSHKSTASLGGTPELELDIAMLMPSQLMPCTFNKKFLYMPCSQLLVFNTLVFVPTELRPLGAGVGESRGQSVSTLEEECL